MSSHIEETKVIIRGGGDLASGVAHCLHTCGFKVLILEVDSPLVVRRKVSFAQAVIDGETVLEDVRAVKCSVEQQIHDAWETGCIPVCVDPAGVMIRQINPYAVIDATLAKRDTGMRLDMAPLTLALGPGFDAGRHVHIVIETMRGHNLGRWIFKGQALTDTGVPEAVQGYAAERVLRAPCSGTVEHVLDIGDRVNPGDSICLVGGMPVTAPFSGIVRGLIMNGRQVPARLKIGDVDPRGVRENCFTISDKARALGGAVLSAILSWEHRETKNRQMFKV